jgi:hypothetical protein
MIMSGRQYSEEEAVLEDHLSWIKLMEVAYPSTYGEEGVLEWRLGILLLKHPP